MHALTYHRIRRPMRRWGPQDSIHVNAHSFQHLEKGLRARLYSVSQPSPCPVSIITQYIALDRRCEGKCYPFMESVMEGTTTQSYIHDCLIRMGDRHAGHAFRIFFKRHRFLPHSSCLNVYGNILVMQAGKRNANTVVNMCSHDAVVADFMAEKYFVSSLLMLLLTSHRRFAAVLRCKSHRRLPQEMIIYRGCT